MAAPNTAPIYGRVAVFSPVRVTAANTSSAGGGTVGTDIFKAATLDTTNGGFVAFVRFTPTASVAATVTTATVGRVFYSTVGSGSTTNADTFLLGEVTLPSVTAASTTTPTFPIDLPINRPLPPSGFIHVTNHAAPAANTAWVAEVFHTSY